MAVEQQQAKLQASVKWLEQYLEQHAKGVATTAAILSVVFFLYLMMFATIMYKQEKIGFKRVTITKVYAFSFMWMIGSYLASWSCAPLLLLGQRKRARVLSHYLGARLACFMHSVLFQPLVFEGLDNLLPADVPCVYMVNHQSTVDIAVVLALYRNMSWVSKATVFHIPGVGLIMRLAGYVGLQRGSKESGKQMLKDCRRTCLDKGWSVAIFPQGTRRRHKILDFKHGGVTLAQEAKVPLVPITVELPEDMYMFGCKERPKMIVHKPILPSDPLFEDREKLLAHCFDTVINGLSYGPAMLKAQREAISTTQGGKAGAGIDIGADDSKKSK